MSKEKQDIIINGLTRLHNTHANSDNQTIGHSKLDLINSELLYLNNKNVADCASHSLASVRDSTANLETLQSTANGLHTDIKGELAYHNNHTVPNCASHSLLGIKTATEANTVLHTAANVLTTATNSELAYMQNTSTVGSISHSLVNLLSQVTAMGAIPTKSILDFETDYVSLHSGTAVLENHKTGQYHVIGDDATIKQFKLIQMGEMGSPTYTVSIKVYSVGGGGVLTLQSTNNYTSISPQSILGMNAIYYYTSMPTTTGLIHHFPMDYSVDDCKGVTVKLFGGNLVKQPKIGFRSYQTTGHHGLRIDPFDL